MVNYYQAKKGENEREIKMIEDDIYFDAEAIARSIRCLYECLDIVNRSIIERTVNTAQLEYDFWLEKIHKNIASWEINYGTIKGADSIWVNYCSTKCAEDIARWFADQEVAA